MDSDVDLLVVVDHMTDDVRRIVAEAAFEASIISREPIEYIVMSLEEYRMRGLGNVFIYEVESHGKVFTMTLSPRRRWLKG